MEICNTLLVILGLYVLLPKLIFIYEYLKKAFFIKSYDKLTSKFNKQGQWAVITGCTAGIGEEISYRLAQ